jgi:hypothetical protein
MIAQAAIVTSPTQNCDQRQDDNVMDLIGCARDHAGGRQYQGDLQSSTTLPPFNGNRQPKLTILNTQDDIQAYQVSGYSVAHSRNDCRRNHTDPANGT